MTRLDKYLVDKGFFSSRNQAQEAILRGEVMVNGQIAKKFSYKVKPDDKVEVFSEGYPRGYYKLAYIDNNLKFFDRKGLKVLDLGSSRGGFGLYAKIFASQLVGIEISRQFEDQLKEVFGKNIIFQDVFKIDIEKLEKRFGDFDIILADLTLEPQISFEGVSKFLKLLKQDGKILWVCKGKDCVIEFWTTKWRKYGFKNIRILPGYDRQEFYFVCEK